MKLSDFAPKQRVTYIPRHAEGNANHPDSEHGTVSSVGAQYVFVKFDKQLNTLGWDGTTSQACDPEDLQK